MQGTAHVPLVQTSPLQQTAAPPQTAPAAWHGQLPPTQLSPAAHVVPHAPQCWAFVWRSTQAFEQFVCPLVHTVAQAPLLHT
jgi:hypothetical protein